jgi:sugar lactone lactonase YvrE
VEMPYSKLRASVSDLYWQNGVAMDYRTWIAPQIYTPPTFADFRANRDPALEAILADKRKKESNRAAAAPLAYRVSTVAGTGAKGYGGDGGPAVAAKLDRPTAVSVDRDGTFYIADYGNNRIRKVTTDGKITTFAGTGEAGFSGDGGPASAAKLSGPYGVRADGRGNVYIADARNGRVRKVSPDGIIATVAGNGQPGAHGDGGLATSASLGRPDDVLADDAGDLYIVDADACQVRKVTPDGIIHTVAGSTTFQGDGGPATAARLNVPAAIALDRQGNLYIADLRNHAVRKVSPEGSISTVAGTGKPGFDGDGSSATMAHLREPGGVVCSPDGSVFIADGVNFRVRRIGTDGVIQTIAGTGKRGYTGDGVPALEADLGVLDILSMDAEGNIYVADHSNQRIRKLTPPAAREK